MPARSRADQALKGDAELRMRIGLTFIIYVLSIVSAFITSYSLCVSINLTNIHPPQISNATINRSSFPLMLNTTRLFKVFTEIIFMCRDQSHFGTK